MATLAPLLAKPFPGEEALALSSFGGPPPRREPIGTGLLPPDFGDGIRQELASSLGTVYHQVHRSRLVNSLEWEGFRELVAKLRSSWEDLGLEAPPMTWDAFWKGRIDLPVPSNDAVAHSLLVLALATDYGTRFCEHILYRHGTNGNVHVRARGPTGSGKSSCLISLMDWTKPIPPTQLTRHLAFDIHELPRKLLTIEPGHGVLLDELVATAGEGSRTSRMMLENLEDTMRASEKDLYISSPSQSEHSTMQVELECIAWSPKPRRANGTVADVCARCLRRGGAVRVQVLDPNGRCSSCQWRPFSVFLAWVEGVPMGVVALPWCSREHYARYTPWKQANVERSLAGQFKDNEQTAKTVMALFEDERFVEYLWLGVNKPKMGDFNTAIVLMCRTAGMLTQAQVERMAKFAYEQCYSFQRLESRFTFLFGVEPNAGFRKIAAKCYEE